MTLQTGEEINYNGNDYIIHDQPLYPYIKKHNINFVARITCCWRGYHGSWSIEENKLYLVGLYGWTSDNPKKHTNIKRVNLNDLFPNQEKVFADWFTGKINIPYGEIIGHDFICGDIYKNEFILEFESGVLVKTQEVENSEKDISYLFR